MHSVSRRVASALRPALGRAQLQPTRSAASNAPPRRLHREYGAGPSGGSWHELRYSRRPESCAHGRGISCYNRSRQLAPPLSRENLAAISDNAADETLELRKPQPRKRDQRAGKVSKCEQ